MKKWLALTLLLFCIPALVWGWGTVIISGSSSSNGETSTFCDSCTGTSDADIFCEDCSDDSGDGKICTWTENIGNGSINWKNTHTGTWCCADKGNYDLEITTNTTDATYVRYDYGEDHEPWYILFYFMVTDENLSNDEDDVFLTLKRDSWATNLTLALYQDSSGDLKLKAVYGIGSYQDTTSYSTTTLSANTVYRIRIHIADSDLDIYLANCDGSDEETVVDSADVLNNYGSRYLTLGAGSQTASCTYEFDNIKADDDSFPGTCSQ